MLSDSTHCLTQILQVLGHNQLGLINGQHSITVIESTVREYTVNFYLPGRHSERFVELRYGGIVQWKINIKI